jgi:hypothetical protein
MRRIRTLTLITGLTLIAGLAVLLAACDGQSAPTAPVAATTYAGMVQGTVWVTNEYANSHRG